MSDVLTKEQRHKNMQHIRAKDTKAEVILRKELWHKGYRYRKNWNELPGKPDIVLTKYKICIFVDSEYFHGKGFYGDYDSRKYDSLKDQIEHGNRPDFWMKKIERNMQRDDEVDVQLAGLGWTVFHFWSKDVLNHTEECVRTVEEAVFDKKMKN